MNTIELLALTDTDWPARGQWCIYIIEAEDGCLYTGITNHLANRWKAHCEGKGARYFRTRPPKRIVYIEPTLNRSTASQRESAIKSLRRNQKIVLIQRHSHNREYWDNRPLA